MDSIKEDLKAIRADVSEIKTTMAVNTKSLEHHVARTDAAERRIDRVEDWALRLLGALVLAAIVGIAKLLFI